METIMQQIREVLDEPLLQKGFVYDEATSSYSKTWDGLENVNYGYFFRIRKKGGYAYMDISLQVMHEEIRRIYNEAQIKGFDRDKSLTEAQQKRLIRDLKKGKAITGLYQFTNLQEEYKDASHWVYQCILSDLSELPGYDQQLLSLFMFGEQWVRTHASWDSLIAWTAKENHNYLSALAILHYLGREEDFNILKREAYEYYIKENLSTHSLESISI